jgi:hypothetical protein
VGNSGGSNIGKRSQLHSNSNVVSGVYGTCADKEHSANTTPLVITGLPSISAISELLDYRSMTELAHVT